MLSLLQVLDNGLLVDPHDQQSIADALLKLVSDKQLWVRCRQNGLKNIHLFSWPEHCKAYLSRIISCKPRQPQWQRSDDGLEKLESDSPGDSLRDIQDLSLNLKFSLDGDKIEEGITFDNALDTEENSGNGKNKLENATLAWSKRTISGTQKPDQNISTGKFPAMRRRTQIFVIAVDSDSNSDFLEIIKKVVETARKGKSAGFIGIILSTALTISEVHSLLASGGLSPLDFDAFICNSGSELYYPSSGTEDVPGLPFVVDLDYHSHTEYRWGGEGLRKTLVRWAASINDKMPEEGKIVEEDESRSTAHCYAFKVANPSLVILTSHFANLMQNRNYKFLLLEFLLSSYVAYSVSADSSSYGTKETDENSGSSVPYYLLSEWCQSSRNPCVGFSIPSPQVFVLFIESWLCQGSKQSSAFHNLFKCTLVL